MTPEEQAEFDKLKADLTQAQTDLANAQENLTKANADLAKALEDLTASKAELDQATTSLKEATDKITTLEADRDQLHADLLKLSEEKAAVLTQSENAGANADELLQQLEAEKNKVSELQVKIDSNEVKIMLDQAIEKIKALEQQNDVLLIETKKWGITTLEDAKKHVAENYKPGPKVKTIMVCQDGNVFFDYDIAGSGRMHVQEKKMLSFTFKNE